MTQEANKIKAACKRLFLDFDPSKFINLPTNESTAFLTVIEIMAQSLNLTYSYCISLMNRKGWYDAMESPEEAPRDVGDQARVRRQ